MSLLLRPVSIKELLRAYNESCAAEKHLVAGGTDWVIKYRGKLSDDSLVLDLSMVEEMRGIKICGGGLFIGAMETMSAINKNRSVKIYASALADAASAMGSLQIRNRATLGGNLANSSPAADTPSALAALDASVIIASVSGERISSIEGVIKAPEVNALGEGEVIRGFSIPLREGYVSAFRKIGSRSEVSIARLNMAASAHCREGIFYDSRVYVGTLGSPAKRCTDAEKALETDPAMRLQALKCALADFAEKTIPGRSTLPYKKSAVQALGEDILAMLLQRCGERSAAV